MQVAGQAGAAGVVAGQGAVPGGALAGLLAEALVGASAEALMGQSATVLGECSLAPKGGWSLGKGSRQTNGKSLPMGRRYLMGSLGALPV